MTRIRLLLVSCTVISSLVGSPALAQPSDETPPQERAAGENAGPPPMPPRVRVETPPPRAGRDGSWRVFPSVRVMFGAGWLSENRNLTIDFAVGINAIQRPGLGVGALIGFTRRSEDPEWTALTVGVPFGFVSRNARFGVGVRPDLLVGRGAGEPLVGGRTSLFIAYRQTVFVEGGYERLRVDSVGVDGYRVMAGIDLGVVFAGIAMFGGALL